MPPAVSTGHLVLPMGHASMLPLRAESQAHLNAQHIVPGAAGAAAGRGSPSVRAAPAGAGAPRSVVRHAQRLSQPPAPSPSSTVAEPSVVIVSPPASPLPGRVVAALKTPSQQSARPSIRKVAIKRKAGAKTAAGSQRATAAKFRKGAGASKAASKEDNELEGSPVLGSLPIDVDMPLGGQPASQMLYIPEDTLKQVVAAALAPLREDISMTRKDVKEMKGTLSQVRQTVDAQGQSIDRMAGGLTSVNNKIEKGAADVKETKNAPADEKDGAEAALKQKLALAHKNFTNMDVARTAFKQRMKEDMGLTDVSTRVYPSGAGSYEDSVRAIMEVHSMSEKEANTYALSIRTFPRRDKTSVKEMRVSSLIVSCKSHFGQLLKAKVLVAWCPIAGVKMPAKRERKSKGAKQQLVNSSAKKFSKAGGKRTAKTSTKKAAKGKTAVYNKAKEAVVAEKLERANAAKKWLKDDAYAKTPTGFKALMAAVANLLRFLGVAERVVKPKTVGQVEYNCCTMGHVCLPAAVIRDYLEKEAGIRSRRRCGVADGMYEQFAAELRRLHKWLPTDGKMKDGLLLVDGANKNRCKFEADAADAVANARLLNTENQAASKGGASSDVSDDGSGSVGAGSELEEEEIDFDVSGCAMSAGGNAGAKPAAASDEEGADLDDGEDGEGDDSEGDGDGDEEDDEDEDDDGELVDEDDGDNE